MDENPSGAFPGSIPPEAREMLATYRVARLATVDSRGRPHVIPVVFAFDGTRLYTPLDAKPKRVEGAELQRVKNIRVNPHVMLLLDHYADDWSQLAWLQVRGTATILESGPEHARAVKHLEDKYPQYYEMPLHNHLIIAIMPERVVHWAAS
jgi:PPOX class probable F420-dependent enzyme